MRAWGIAVVLVFFFLVRFIANRLIDRVIRSVTERELHGPAPVSAGRLRTLGGLIKSIIFYVLVLISIIMLLDTLNIDTKPILTAAGVLGLAIGFGAQKLVRDVLAGFFVVLENQYSIGEYVTLGAVTGTVVELGMRVTQLRDDVGKLVTIANGDIVMVTNHSRGPITASIEVSVAPDSDVDAIRALIDEAGRDVASSVEGVIQPPRAGGITAVDSTRLTIRVCGEVRPGRQDAVQTALREAVYDKFMHHGIVLAPVVE